MKRRALIALSAAPLLRLRSETPRAWRAAVIGRTGAGDYGHGYDLIFKDMPGVTVTAVADADPAGRRKAMARSGAANGYETVAELLERERPELVSIAFRQPQGHAETALSCLAAGVKGLFMEKPFTVSPAEADAVLAAADRAGARIAVAHHRRYAKGFVNLRAQLAAGLIGTVRDVRIDGKQDARAGGEDLMVLGTHDFDFLRWCFGDPRWCLAHIGQDGRDARPEDVRPGNEKFLVAGDRIFASFGFANGVRASWSSMKTSDHWNTDFQRPREKWAFEIHGTKGVLAHQAGLDFAWLESPFLAHLDGGPAWKPVPEAAQDWTMHERHPVRSLLHALEAGGQPVCSGRDGAWAVEMAAAVYQSHFSGRRVEFPLRDRSSGLPA